MLGISFSKVVFTVLLVLGVIFLFNTFSKSLRFKKSKMENNNYKVLNTQFCDRCRNYISTNVNLDCKISNCPWC
ncbi:MAG: hypothetical protein CMM49_08080 [Rhodospirillaceae bacterium]|nr:hypothetical protein [Rhodospirillaceae bacterium]